MSAHGFIRNLPKSLISEYCKFLEFSQNHGIPGPSAICKANAFDFKNGHFNKIIVFSILFCISRSPRKSKGFAFDLNKKAAHQPFGI